MFPIIIEDLRRFRIEVAVVLALLLCAAGVYGLTSCVSPGNSNGAFSSNPITAESVEGLILEGEGPIPARLIYRSRNTISSEEDRLILESIFQELDKLVDLAGQLDEVIMAEAYLTDLIVPPASRPVYDNPLAKDMLETPLYPMGSSENLSVAVLYERVKSGRQRLLETRLSLVRKANEAKQRNEELSAGGAINPQSKEILRKDLEMIKEAQRVLATVLSDIMNATTNDDTVVDDSTGLAVARVYLGDLIRIYEDKVKQLSRFAEAIDLVVRLA